MNEKYFPAIRYFIYISIAIFLFIALFILHKRRSDPLKATNLHLRSIPLTHEEISGKYTGKDTKYVGSEKYIFVENLEIMKDGTYKWKFFTDGDLDPLKEGTYKVTISKKIDDKSMKTTYQHELVLVSSVPHQYTVKYEIIYKKGDFTLLPKDKELNRISLHRIDVSGIAKSNVPTICDCMYNYNIYQRNRADLNHDPETTMLFFKCIDLYSKQYYSGYIKGCTANENISNVMNDPSTPTFQQYEDGDTILVDVVTDSEAPVIESSIENRIGVTEVLSFIISKNKKKVTLSVTNDKRLKYKIVRKDGEQEFQFPTSDNSSSSFRFIKEREDVYSLIFQNTSATYRIYEIDNKIGIVVKTDGKTYNLVGDINTKEGSLQRLKELLLINVVEDSALDN
ncbi:hypothetical protein GCM10027275_41580 [Rhabdobacter roseus]|uniref:Uncharacterized protein n=1 Tax=Rhabdobacter roseus TaxID=1655419 RepID=A0A840TTB1_9BACT|nr:hypothetical protein [Rhabdobacter roseus]MBB5286135.1 hypothetical protein [Rhabdobacter roseus]